jgi:D-alanine-D-alanine ligase
MSQLATATLPPYPLFVKPIRGRGSAGITEESIVHNAAELERACKRILYSMHQGALIEEYVQGMEITIGLIGNGSDLTVLPPLEIEYSGTTRTNTYEHKQDKEIFHCPARLPKETLEQLSVAARNAYVSLGAKDFGRVDFIYDPLTKLPYALELNTFAGLQILSSDEVHLHQSYIGKMSTTIGWSSKDLFQRLLMSCLQRINLEAKVEATNS